MRAKARAEIGDKMNEEISRRIDKLKGFGKCTVCNDWHLDMSDPCEGHKYPTGAFSNFSPLTEEQNAYVNKRKQMYSEICWQDMSEEEVRRRQAAIESELANWHAKRLAKLF
jgi:hypothetical protein